LIMRGRILTILLAFLWLSGTPALAADLARGKKLHDANCMNCHTPGVYTRPDRRIDSLEALNRQVQRCETALGAKWPADDVADVVHYLNKHYYKFE